LRKQLAANISTNFKFYRRNRLILLIALFLLFILGLFSVPSLFFITTAKKFTLVQDLVSVLDEFAVFITVALGLLSISYNLRNRCLKMVITKPCSMENWLFSHFISALMVCAALFLFILVVSSVLLFIWHIPMQWGIVYVILDEFFRAMIILSYIIFLTVIFHPVLAVLVALFFQAGTFYGLTIWAKAGLEVGIVKKAYLHFLEKLFYALYMILPSMSPYSSRTRDIYLSFRVKPSEWKYLLFTFIYAVMVSVFFYFLADYFLKKRRHI